MSAFSKRFSFEPADLLFSAFLGLLGSASLLLSADLSLHDFPGNMISSATLDGFAVAQRVRAFYLALSALILVFLASNAFLKYLSDRYDRQLFSGDLMILVSTLGITVLAARALHSEVSNEINTLVSIIVLGLLSYYLSDKNSSKEAVLNDTFRLLLIAFSLPFFIKDLLVMGAGLSMRFFFNEWVLYSGVLLLMALRLMGKTINDIPGRILLLTAALPVISFLSRELVVMLEVSADFFLPALGAYALLFALIIILVFSLPSFKKPHFNADLKSAILLLSGIVMAAHHNYLIEVSREMFELANPVLALERFFRWNEWPVLESFNSHLFFETLFGFVYAALHGYSGLDFLAYGSFHYLIAFVLIFYLFHRFFGNVLYALLITLFFPFLTAVFHLTFTVCLIFTFILYRFYKKPSAGNLGLLISGLVLMVLWKIDFGVASILSVTGVLILLMSAKQLTFHTKDWMLVLGSIGFVLAIIAAIANLAGIPVWENFQQAYHYVNSAQAHGLLNISDASMSASAAHYYFFPILMLALLLYMLFHLGKLLKEKTFETIALLFLIGFYFANFHRGLIRHGLIHGDIWLSSFVFFILPASVFILPLSDGFKKWKIPAYLFLTILLTSAFKFHGLEKPHSLGQAFLAQFSQSDELFASKIDLDTRLLNKAEVDGRYGTLKAFMDKLLTPEETFYDYSNSPMLYYYLKRKVPSYFNQPLLSSQDRYLQEKQIELLDDQVPIVVYSNYPENWYDAQDGVPKNLRHVFLGEYINRNYRPLAVIDGFTIWGKRDREFGRLLDVQELDSNWRSGFDSKRVFYALAPIGYEFGPDLKLEYSNGWNDVHHIDSPNEALLDALLKDSLLELYSANYYPDLYSLRKRHYRTHKLAGIWADDYLNNRKGRESIPLLKIDGDVANNYLVPDTIQDRPWIFVMVKASLIYDNEDQATLYAWDESGRELFSFGFAIDSKQSNAYLIRLSTMPSYFFHRIHRISIDVSDRVDLESVDLIGR